MRWLCWKFFLTRSLQRTAFVLLSLPAVGGMAEGGSITPLSSSFALTAFAEVGTSVDAETLGESQGSTINPLSVDVSANAISAPTDQNLLVTADGSAKWTTPSIGQVTYTDVGWSNALGSGGADLSANTGWIYSFTANIKGSFVIDYTVTAEGMSSTVSDPLVGLNGFFLYQAPPQAPPPNPSFETGINTSGVFSLAIDPGQTYTVHIQNFANLFGDIGTTDAHMDASFDFNVQFIPEPSSLRLAMIAALVGATIVIKLRRTNGPLRNNKAVKWERSGRG
jgi:hypothetical protein